MYHVASHRLDEYFNVRIFKPVSGEHFQDKDIFLHIYFTQFSKCKLNHVLNSQTDVIL